MTRVLEEARQRFANLRQTAEGALAQISDEEFFALPEPSGETNSIALVVKHIAGNARSRWTDFLTSDGEKPDRDRDTEFERFDSDSRAALMAAWARGWDLVDQALAPLSDDDLERTITIRGEPHTVSQAILRQIAHYGYHVGQIVLLARIARGNDWSTLSVPRGHSAKFNAAMRASFQKESPRDP
jgi:uncharacterized damage-inducible protein DinB